MKKLLLGFLLMLFCSTSFAAIGVVRNLGSDPTTAQTPAIASCNLYRGAALVVNKPTVVVAGKDTCFFPAIPLLPSESYTASYVNVTGFEGPVSIPFATGSAPGAPSALKPVPDLP